MSREHIKVMHERRRLLRNLFQQSRQAIGEAFDGRFLKDVRAVVKAEPKTRTR